ncbi:MAG: type II toxin-antitoxin system YhaV family toxin [Syntrophobacteraceae bacterium]
MSQDKWAPQVVNDCTIFAHPLFLDQLEALTRQVEELRQKDPDGFTRKNSAKRLVAIAKLSQNKRSFDYIDCINELTWASPKASVSRDLDVDAHWKFPEYLASLQFPLGVEEAHIAILVAKPELLSANFEIEVSFFFQLGSGVRWRLYFNDNFRGFIE